MFEFYFGLLFALCLEYFYFRFSRLNSDAIVSKIVYFLIQIIALT